MNDSPYILVLGASSDIGRAIAHEYARHGYNLHLAARNSKRLMNDVNDLKIRYEVKATVHEFDALDYDSHLQFYMSLDPKPEGVVCVVGYLGNQKKAEKEALETRKIIETNYNGCVSILNIAASDLEKEGKGFIVGISSVAGDRGRQSNYYYGSSKAALTAYLSGLRNRLAKKGVHVLTVKPGFVRTKMTEGMKLPPVITATAEKVARDIFKAQQKNKNIIYTKWHWKYIMLIIRNIPEGIFKKMEL